MQHNHSGLADGVIMIDSINYLQPQHCGAVVLASSHGGLYSAYKAVTLGARAVVLNDAGGGLQQAGIAALAYGEKVGMPAATVSHMSARIGDVKDMHMRGIISHANGAAARLGVCVGMDCRSALTLLQAAELQRYSVPQMAEHRHELSLQGHMVVCIDSASLVQATDKNRIVITGSHGGLIAGDSSKAINVPVALAAFNDAGVGMEQAGLGRLVPLAQLGIPAVTVSSQSARIGDAMSTYQDGIISYANSCALALGVRPGQRLQLALESWLEDHGPHLN